MNRSASKLVGVLGLALSLGQGALAAGGTVRPATSGGLDFIYALTPPGANDRAITRYGFPGVPAPGGSEFCPNTILCGARTRSGHQSAVSENRPLVLDIRLEDPANPGFPNVLAVPPVGVGTISPTSGLGADSNTAPAQCPQFISFQSYTFNNALGVPDPRAAVFLTWKFEPPGSTTPCLLGLELFSAPGNGRSLYYYTNGAIYGALTFAGTAGNHWLEMVAFTPAPLRAHVRMHGSPQFAGDPGLPVWFHRADVAGTIVDDYISTTILVDNPSPAPVSGQNLRLLADLSAFRTGPPPPDAATFLRMLGSPSMTLASGNPYTWAPGRTRLDANFPAPLRARIRPRLPANVGVTLSITPAVPPGPVSGATSTLGLRRHRGQIDDRTAEAAYIVQAPVMTGDVLAQQFPLIRLFPRVGGNVVSRLNVTRIDVGAVATMRRAGFDAVQVRRGDPVIRAAADQSPQGLLGGTGTVGDGVIGVRIPPHPSGVCALFSLPQIPAIAIPNTDDIWVTVYPFPGRGMRGSAFLCADLTAATALNLAYVSPGGAQPYTLFPDTNFIVRLAFAAFPFVRPGDACDGPEPLEARAVPLRLAGGEVPSLNRSPIR